MNASREMTPDELEAAGLPRDLHAKARVSASSPVPSSETEEELLELLDDYDLKWEELFGEVIEGRKGAADAGRDRLAQSRAAIRGYVSRLQSEIERLQEIVAEQILEMQEAFEDSPQGKELIALRSQLSRIQQTGLTENDR